MDNVNVMNVGMRSEKTRRKVEKMLIRLHARAFKMAEYIRKNSDDKTLVENAYKAFGEIEGLIDEINW